MSENNVILIAPQYGEKKVKSPNTIILWSSSTNNPNSKLSAQHLVNTLLSRNIRLEQLDGAKTENKKLRNQLCKISKKRIYPQVFIKHDTMTIKFIGVDVDVNFLMEIDGDKFDDIFGCCLDTDHDITESTTDITVDKSQEAVRFKILAEQWLDAGNLFKAQKFARKSMRLDDSDEIKTLLERIKTEQATRHREPHHIQQNELLDIVIDDDQKAEIPLITESIIDLNINTGAETPQANDDLVNTILEQSALFQRKNDELEKENKLLREQLAAAESINYERKKVEVKRGCCYECNEVKEYSYKQREDIKIRSGVESSQMESNNKMKSHSNRLDEWMKYSSHLDSVFCGREGKDTDVSSLYLLYVECISLLKEEEQRTEDVMAHCMDLNCSTSNLKSIISIYNVDVPSTKDKYDGLCVKYNTIRKKREDLQRKVSDLVLDINNMIDEENTFNNDKCVTLDKFNLLRMELDEYEKILLESRRLTKQYSQFEDNVEQKSIEFDCYFRSKWDKHEEKWSLWDVNGIIVWLKYLIDDNKLRLCKGFDLDNISHKMIEQQICGGSLNKMDKSDLKSCGFHIFDDRDQVYKRIRALVEKYPVQIDDDEKDNIDNNTKAFPAEGPIKIPTEYKCRISGKIMMDPVVAYDNKTYEKKNIIEYIKKHGRAPDSQHKCDVDEPLVRHKQLKTMIEQFLWANPQITDGE